MKYFQKIWTIILSVALCSTSIAQVHTITFTGKDWTNQYHIPLHHVTVFNLDQLWEEVLYYPDTTLVLGTVGVDSYNVQDVQLMQNVPNPFDGITEFALVLTEGGDVQMEIYDIAGRLAVGRHFSDLQAGTHLFQTTLASPQTYLLSAKVEGGQMTIKMVNEGHGAGNTIQHLGMTNLQGDFTLYLKNDKYSGGYPFSVGDEMKYTGYALIDGGMKESNIIQCHQNNNDTYTLQFDVTAPTVTTASANSITSYSAVCGGNVTVSGGSPVVARGVCWSTSHNPTLSNSHVENGTGLGGFTCSITGLTTGTTYYVRAYATNGVGTAYGSEKSFTTLSLPTVTTNTVTNIMGVTATSGGQVTSDGGDYVTARGVCWSTSQNPTVSGSHTTNGNGTGSFTSNITGLSTGTTYYVRAYATNSVGTAYGEQRTFTTATLPTVTTSNLSNITGSSAACGGNVTSTGGSTVTGRGVCWSTSSNPTVGDSHTSNGSGTGSFTSDITGLSAGTNYYLRAYATNSVGTAYGEQKNFTTNSTPTITTKSVTNITGNSATCGGNVVSAGGSVVTARGVCWSTSQNPTVSNSHTSNGGGTGSFTSNMSGLFAGTTYYVRAYATNSVGTAYGEQRSFMTNSTPTITTDSVTNVTGNSATCGGNVISSGGSVVNARGVCWSTSQNPTVGNSHTSNGNGTGNFTSNLIGLSAGTTYYVRAYATNDMGTAYGEQKSFTTNSIPTITTYNVINITVGSATSGGNVTSTGGAAVTARGVCWSMSPNPTISDNHTTNGSGTGGFTSNITGLMAGETYYLRAYATNSVGTAYGSSKVFTTDTCPTTVQDYDNNTYNTVIIGSQCWMKENMRATHYANGDSIAEGSSISSTTPYYYNYSSCSIPLAERGYLYNWPAVMHGASSHSQNPSGVQGVCPMGWHVPSDAEWTQLTDYVSSQSIYHCDNDSLYIAKALASTTYWTWHAEYPCRVAYMPSDNNSTGFSAVPAGLRNYDFCCRGTTAVFWSTTERSSSSVWERLLLYEEAHVIRTYNSKYEGNSVRCLKN
ncbi:MAG: hypothetical protein K5882_05405 [Bacteroidales bacterium]|nr:hypothetical protein [Bacteroidales bacterium]